MSDTDTDEPGFGATLKLEIGALGDRMEKALHRAAPILPISQTMGNSVLIGSNGIGVIKFDGPEAGQICHVRGIRVSGASPTTTAAGRADIYVVAGDSTQSGAAMPQTAWRDQATTIPLVAPYSLGEMTIKPREILYVVFSSATSGQEYYASMTFEQIAISAERTPGAMPL